MFKSRVFGTLLPVSIVGAIVLGVAGAVGHAEDPGAFAIRNARIVPVSGPAIDNGTVVVSGGLITAVGASVEVPADAWVIDGKGLTVYPGLIDALTDLGLTPAAAARRGAAPAVLAARRRARPVSAAARQATPARGPQDRPASTPWVQAADDVKVDERRFESWRNAGFTTALTAPKTGIFPGQGAVINLAGERAGDLVVASPVTLQVNFTPPGGFGGFPGSLMGVYAYVRQVYLDVQHDVDVRKQYDASPRGVERPEYDRTVRAVAEAQAANRPVLMAATSEAQIARILDFAQELKLRPVLYGVHESYKPAAAERLAAKKTPVLVSLKWPERDASGDPEAEESLRVLRLRDKAPVRARRAAEGRREVRVLLGWRAAAGSPQERAQGRRGGARRRRRGEGVHARRGGNSRRRESPRQHRDRQDRQSRGDRRRSLRREDEGEDGVRRRPQVRRARHAAAGASAARARARPGADADGADDGGTLESDGEHAERRAHGDGGSDDGRGRRAGGQHDVRGGHLGDFGGLAHRQPVHVHDDDHDPQGPMTLTFTGTIEGNTIKGSIGGGINGDFTGTRPTGPTSSNPEDESGFSIGHGRRPQRPRRARPRTRRTPARRPPVRTTP